MRRSFSSSDDGADGQERPGHFADRHSPDADGTRRKNQRSIFENVPADRHLGCRLEERRLRYVPVFGQLFRQTQCLSANLNGRAGDKEQ